VDGAPTREVTLREIGAQGGAKFTDAGLTLLAPAVVQRLKALGLVGVFVTPDPAQFRVEEGRVIDTRATGETEIILQVTTGVVTDVRSVAVGERIDPDETINHPLHERIRTKSPVQAYAAGATVRSDLIRKDVLDDYTFRLNRHPGRRVDVAVSAPGDEPGAVTLDYVVTENRPWLAFLQLSNTGSESTDNWRQHFGFIHNDLSNADDILTFDYQTSNFDNVNAFTGSYERPLSFNDRVRWKVFGSWYEYVASDLGFPDADFSGDGWTGGGEVAWNFYQNRDLFIDFVAGFRFDHLNVDNEAAAVSGENDFLIPLLAFRLERVRDVSSTRAQVGVEFNLADAAGTDESTIDDLGRFDADAEFAVLRGELTHSFYLDPFLREDAENSGGLAHELLFSAKAQYAFDNRLIPNEQQIAGGLYTVRGYPFAIVAGDNAAIGTAEYRFHLPRALSPSVDPGTFLNKPFRWRPQYAFGPTDWDLILKAFIDAGRVTNNDIQSFETNSTLVGAGVGAELALTRRFNIRTDLGFALKELEDAVGETTVDAGDAELHFVLTLIY